ncbi:hypothetical protein RINTU1_28070 [Candidatus Regiella insecticola]|uniref:Uncharacterized protein n=1 Tax=Candidatus Regiella insecticola TaxID=138073 RepID=A0A6L2ZR33_9ENTR|nr:hypothetical protein RINTU1_28070 [Candidatus Regiella insecticola]
MKGEGYIDKKEAGKSVLASHFLMLKICLKFSLIEQKNFA